MTFSNRPLHRCVLCQFQVLSLIFLYHLKNKLSFIVSLVILLPKPEVHCNASDGFQNIQLFPQIIRQISSSQYLCMTSQSLPGSARAQVKYLVSLVLLINRKSNYTESATWIHSVFEISIGPFIITRAKTSTAANLKCKFSPEVWNVS